MNGTLTRARTTARVAPTLHDELVIPPATGYGRDDSCSGTGFTWGCSSSPFHNTTETPAPQDLFATAPVQAMWREFDWQREEEAYTSFEAAISKRVLALKERRISASKETDTRGSVTSAMQTLASAAATTWYKVCSRRVWRGGLLLAGLALMLILAGFDLMGLLVLYAR